MIVLAHVFLGQLLPAVSLGQHTHAPYSAHCLRHDSADRYDRQTPCQSVLSTCSECEILNEHIHCFGRQNAFPWYRTWVQILPTHGCFFWTICADQWCDTDRYDTHTLRLLFCSYRWNQGEEVLSISSTNTGRCLIVMYAKVYSLHRRCVD